MKYNHVFDLDNTLVYTNDLNNEAYNIALEQVGILPIVNQKRITREVLFQRYPSLPINLYNDILRLKQDYFIRELDKTILNKELFDFIRSLDSDNCILWTSADEARVEAIIDYYNIRRLFKEIIFSNKLNVSRDLELFCNILSCTTNEIIFYEDNRKTIDDLLGLNLNVVIIFDKD